MQGNALFHERALHEIRLDESFPIGHAMKRIEKYTLSIFREPEA